MRRAAPETTLRCRRRQRSGEHDANSLAHSSDSGKLRLFSKYSSSMSIL
jgi:hypothetical protein